MNNFSALIISLSICFLVQCHRAPNKDNTSSETIIISGKHLAPNAPFHITPAGQHSEFLVRSTSDSAAYFRVEFNAHPKGLIYNLSAKGSRSIYALPGDSINIDLVSEEGMFSGDNINENQLLAQLDTVIKYSELYKMDDGEDRFVYLKEKYTLKKQIVEANHAISKNFKRRFLIALKWDFIKSQLPPVDYYANFQRAVTRPSYLSFLKDIELDETELLEYANRIQLLDNYFLHMEHTGLLNSEVKNYIEKRVSSLSNSSLQEEYALYLIERDMHWKKTFLLNNIALSEGYIKSAEGKKALDEFKIKATETQTKYAPLAPGQPAPDFTVKDLFGDDVSLSDYRGQLIFLDMWTLGCHPCKLEMPFLNDLEHHFKDEAITFITISFDPDKNLDQLKNYIEEHQLGGLQLIESEGFKSQLRNDYMLSGVPNYVIISPDGTIIDASSERPSNPLLKKFLEKLLKQTNGSQ
jgi:peroxiredoxin